MIPLQRISGNTSKRDGGKGTPGREDARWLPTALEVATAARRNLKREDAIADSSHVNLQKGAFSSQINTKSLYILAAATVVVRNYRTTVHNLADDP